MKFLLAGLIAGVVADVTVPISNVPPLPLRKDGYVTSAADLFRISCPEEGKFANGSNTHILLSSYADFGASQNHVFGTDGNSYVFPSSDSFIRGALDAWAQHQHLVLRPDEVWFEILVQMNFYMTAHAEDIRDLFVNFTGREEIKVLGLNWRDVIGAFSSEIAKRVKTKWLLDWIMPGFTTSDRQDELTATVLMMGLLQHYFSFSGGIVCGIPKVTLMGTKFDWQRLLGKLDRLKEFGKEAEGYAKQLKPILSRFVATFDNPTDPDLKIFWEQIVRVQKQFTCGEGPIEYDVSGWILGFMHWNEQGQLRVPKTLREAKAREEDFVLDGEKYVPCEMDKLFTGYAKAPLKMLDYPSPGVDTMAYVLGGNVGVNRTQVERGGEVIARPMSSWFLVVNGRNETEKRRSYGSFGELQGIARDLSDQNCGARDMEYGNPQ